MQVARWRERYLQFGLEGIERDLPRGAPPVKVDVQKRVELTTQRTPEAATHCSTRKMGAVLGAVLGVSASTVLRHWQANGLKPHIVRGFKVSRVSKKTAAVRPLALNQRALAPRTARASGADGGQAHSSRCAGDLGVAERLKNDTEARTGLGAIQDAEPQVGSSAFQRGAHNRQPAQHAGDVVVPSAAAKRQPLLFGPVFDDTVFVHRELRDQ